MDGEYIHAYDLSMSSPGCAIFDLDGNPIGVFSKKTVDKESHGKRLKDIANWAIDLIEKYPPHTAVIERAFSRFNTATANIYRVHGIINMLYWTLPQIYYPPKTVKATILNGNATKAQLQEKIKKIYPSVEYKNEDESDAFCVGLTFFIKKKMINWKK